MREVFGCDHADTKQSKHMKNPKVDAFIQKADQWQEEFQALRAIVLDSGLVEELKWGVPCYAHENANIVLIHGFKAYCALLFVKGVLLKDPQSILVQQTKNVQSARQVRFTNVQDITTLESTLKAYIAEAVEIEKAGVQVAFKPTKEFDIPEEFQQKLDDHPGLKQAFESLTPGRQRAYLLYFSSATQSKTRAARVEKSIEPILAGKGLND